MSAPSILFLQAKKLRASGWEKCSIFVIQNYLNSCTVFLTRAHCECAALCSIGFVEESNCFFVRCPHSTSHQYQAYGFSILFKSFQCHERGERMYYTIPSLPPSNLNHVADTQRCYWVLKSLQRLRCTVFCAHTNDYACATVG